jgi:hypothetical protein
VSTTREANDVNQELLSVGIKERHLVGIDVGVTESLVTDLVCRQF